MKKPVKKPLAIPVVVAVRAVEEGYYNGQIVAPGSEFIYKGNLNRAMTLPLWVVPLDPEEAEKIVSEAIAKVKSAPVKEASAPSAPALPPVAPGSPFPAPTASAPALPPLVSKAASGKQLTKVELITKLAGKGKDINELNKMLVADLRALDAQMELEESQLN